MALFYDTNALLHLIRKESVRSMLNPNLEPEYISFVSVAELDSMAYRQRWGEPRLKRLSDLYDRINIVSIEENPQVLNLYVQIDAFSQCKHQTERPAFKTPRNMGKHDLWIAATASVLNLPVVTSDGDFDHLDKVFLAVKKYKPADFV